MPQIQFTFTNNNEFVVFLSTEVPSSNYQTPQGQVDPGQSSTIIRDIPVGSRWQMKISPIAPLFDTYQTTSNAIQKYSIKIRDYRTQINFHNNTAASVFLFSVDSVSHKETQEGDILPGASTIIERSMFDNTEWRIKDATGATIGTYFTSHARYQFFSINPPGTITPVLTPGGTIYSGPIPDNPPLGTPIPNTPVIASAKDSIFNSQGFNIDVANLDFSIRQRAGLTDKHQRRAAVYASLMAIAKVKAQDRTPKEQVLMDWLAFQVKQTRVEAARLALAEYDRWKGDPWSYQPPAGYDFPRYSIAPARSPAWLTHTPDPPVLANQSWQSLLSGIVSSNPWSPLNNPIWTYYGGQQTSSLEGVIGFPVFGAVLAYQKLYNTDAGLRIFANATENLSKTFNLSPVRNALTVGGTAVGLEGSSQLAALRMLALEQIAPYAARQLKDNLIELTIRAGGTATRNLEHATLESVPTQELRVAAQKMASGEIISSFVCTFVLTLALQALITESTMLGAKLKLRDKLVENLTQQQSAHLPDLRNLLYYDIRGEIALFPSDYQPTDPVELERLMGSQEVYRAFLLATIE